MRVEGTGGRMPRIEQLPRNLEKGAKSMFKTFSSKENWLTSEIKSVKAELKRLLSKKKKPWGLIRRLRLRLRMLKGALRALRAKRSSAAGQVNSARGNLARGVKLFKSKWQASDALYKKARGMMRHFPRLQGDYRFLRANFRPNTMLLNSHFPVADAFLRAPFPQMLNFSNIGSINDPNVLVNYLMQVRGNTGELMRVYAQGQRAIFQQASINQALRGEYLRFNKLSLTARMKMIFHKIKSRVFRGFSKVLRVVARGLEAVAKGIEAAAKGLEALANAVQGIPFVGPALAAALRAMAMVLRGIAKALRVAAKVLRNYSKYMKRLSNFLRKLSDKFKQKFLKLRDIAKKFLDKFKQGLNKLNEMRKKLTDLITKRLAHNFKLESQIINRLRQLGENVNLGGFGFPGFGMPGVFGMPGLNPMGNLGKLMMAQMLMNNLGNLAGMAMMMGMLKGMPGLGMGLGAMLPMMGMMSMAGALPMMMGMGMGGFGGFGGGFGGFGGFGGLGGFGAGALLGGAMGLLGGLGAMGMGPLSGMLGAMGPLGVGTLGALSGGLAGAMGPLGMGLLMGAMGALGPLGMLAFGPGFGLGMGLGMGIGTLAGMGIGAIRITNVKKRYEQRMLQLADRIISLRESNDRGTSTQVVALQRELLMIYQISVARFQVSEKVRTRVQEALKGMTGLAGVGGAYGPVPFVGANLGIPMMNIPGTMGYMANQFLTPNLRGIEPTIGFQAGGIQTRGVGMGPATGGTYVV